MYCWSHFVAFHDMQITLFACRQWRQTQAGIVAVLLLSSSPHGVREGWGRYLFSQSKVQHLPCQFVWWKCLCDVTTQRYQLWRHCHRHIRVCVCQKMYEAVAVTFCIADDFLIPSHLFVLVAYMRLWSLWLCLYGKPLFWVLLLLILNRIHLLLHSHLRKKV